MKKRLIPIILIVALLLSVFLTACGNKNNGATPDSASADQRATADSRETSSAASADKKDEGADDKSDSPAASKNVDAAPAAPVQENVQNNADNGGEEQAAETPAPEKQEQSTPKKSTGNTPASSVSPNPAYDDDHRPQFTIVMTDKSSKKEYSAACSYTTDKKEEAYASFFLPAGNYDIAVYEYADKIDKEHPLAESAYNNAKATKRKSIRIYYTPKDNRIEVKESASSRTQ